MPRSGEDARRRLRQAALELYAEQGYERTSAAQVAERAGVNERTFFRHFADKREVLFDGEAALRADLERGVAEAADGSDVLAVLLHAFRLTVPLLLANRTFSEPRQSLIAATPALSERALTKEAALVDALACALRRRGVPPRRATLAAKAGMAAYTQATLDWLADPLLDLEQLIAHALDDVRALARHSADPAT